VDPCLVKLGCFQLIRLKSYPAIKCSNHLHLLLILHYLLHRAIMFGVTHLIIQHSMSQITVHFNMETFTIPILKTQLLEEINNNFIMRLQVTLLVVLTPHYNIQVLSILQVISTLRLQVLAINLKLRVRAYTLSIQVVMAKINLLGEI
jgi:hypothetical protein